MIFADGSESDAYLSDVTALCYKWFTASADGYALMSLEINRGMAKDVMGDRFMGLERFQFHYTHRSDVPETIIRIHRMPNLDGHLFHYTNFNGFIGILQSGEFWMSSIGYSNDSVELQYPFQLFYDCALNAEKRNSKHIDPSSVQMAVSLLHHFQHHFLEPKVFSLSFSPKGNLLSQWRGYGGRGGVSIGISSERLAEIVKVNGMQQGEVIYDHNKQVDLYVPIIEDLFRTLDLGLSPERAPKYVEEVLLPKYKAVRPFIKHEAFAEESEHRIVATSGDVKVRSNGSYLVPYTKLKIPEGTIFSVIIGPTRDADGVRDAILDAFSASPFKQEYILSSQIPFVEG